MSFISRQFPQKWLIGALTLFMVLCLSLTVKRVLHVDTELRQTSAIENATRYSEALMAFRTVYTSEVVNRTDALGIEATHDYLSNPETIPLPATLTKVLAERLGSKGTTHVQLYSDQPFPWRKKLQRLDAFQIKALKALKQNPLEPVVVFEGTGSAETVRYAVADTLRPECVDCHNNHPSSPKRDWNVGDVRGVLEISHALGNTETKLHGDLKFTVRLLFWLSMLGLFSLALSALYLRRSAQVSLALAAEANEARLLTQKEMLARMDAEKARRNAEAQVLYGQKLESLGLLAGGIAHDFNNLLVSILGNTQLIQERSEHDEYNKRRLELVEQAGLKAAGLTKKLLAYAGGGTTTVPRLVSLNDCVRQLTPLLQTATSRNATLVFELDEHLPPILADTIQLEQCILNLVTNAADAIGDKKGQITIRTGSDVDRTQSEEPKPGDAEQTDFTWIIVEDNGSGISPETQIKMFDPFFSTKGASRGLGLATLLGIVTAHKGEILVTSEKDKGTSIQLSFPSDSELTFIQHEPEKDLQKKTRGTNLHVLLVDDEDNARETTSTLLIARGFRVTTTSNGRKTLALATQDPKKYDVILLDMSMPDLTGIETYALLRQVIPETPVVFYSGLDPSPELRTLLKTGAVRFVRKPFTINQIVDALVKG
jgi:signal transduction histidine kinase